MDRRQHIEPVERGRDSEGYLVMVDGLLCLALGMIYSAKHVVTATDMELLFLGQEEIDRRDAASSALSSCPSECNDEAKSIKHRACSTVLPSRS